MKRRDFITLLGGAPAIPALLRPLAARAQTKMPVIGVLGAASAAIYSERLTLIRQALADGGFTEGRSVAMEYRWAEGQLDRLPALAVELVDLRVNVIIATGGAQVPRAAMSATRTIPIVFSTDSDPVQDGIVASLSRPGGSVTGIATITTSLTAKRLDIFRELVPKAKVVAVLVNPTSTQASEQRRDAEEAARALGFESRVLHARDEAELEPAIAALTGVHDAGLLVSADPFFNSRRGIIVASANTPALPRPPPRDIDSGGGFRPAL
jgi:putative tryptophan/tyrosine transport system substrate-binding protein